MFYAYAHVKPDGAIFYIGKGKDRRAWDKDNRNTYWHNVVNKYGYEVKILAHDTDEELSLLCEIEAIDVYKRRGLSLCNMTKGGEGFSGGKHTEQARIKMSLERKGQKNGMYGKKRPEITGKNHHMHNPEIAKKVSEKLKGELNPFAKKVKFKEQTFGSIADLANYLNLRPKTVQRRVRVNPAKYGYEVI